MFLAATVHAEDSFLGLAFGARPLAMGGAYTAVADDAQALLWNPAGLAALDRISLSGSQNHLSFTENVFALTLNVPVGRLGTLALAGQHLNAVDAALTRPVLDAGGNPVLDPLTRQPLVELAGFGRESDGSFLMGYGRAFTPWLQVGGAAKALVGKAGSTSGWGCGVTAGRSGRVPHAVKRGVGGEDLGRTVVRWLDGTRTVLPTVARLGASWEPFGAWLLSADALTPIRRIRVQWTAGTEWRVADVLSLRAGVRDARLTGGVGFRMGTGSGGTSASADYAFVTGDAHEDRNRLTLTVTF